MKNIADMLKGMNKAQIEAAVEKAKEFAATQKGKEIINELKTTGKISSAGISEVDKNKIMKELESNPEIAKRISDILNLLRQIVRDVKFVIYPKPQWTCLCRRMLRADLRTGKYLMLNMCRSVKSLKILWRRGIWQICRVKSRMKRK